MEAESNRDTEFMVACTRKGPIAPFTCNRGTSMGTAASVRTAMTIQTKHIFLRKWKRKKLKIQGKMYTKRGLPFLSHVLEIDMRCV